jgi:VCBS repeat-containing protein
LPPVEPPVPLGPSITPEDKNDGNPPIPVNPGDPGIPGYPGNPINPINPGDPGYPTLDTAKGHNTVWEQDLVDKGSATATGTIEIDAPAGLASVTIGGETLTAADLNALSPENPKVIQTPDGTLTLTGYDETTGQLDYDYELNHPIQHTGENGTTTVDSLDTIHLIVNDQAGGTGEGNLVIQIVDSFPEAKDDMDNISNGFKTTTSGDVVTGTGGSDGSQLAADKLSADTPADDKWVTNGHGDIKGQYGILHLNEKGEYVYELNYNDPNIQGLGKGSAVQDIFDYTITDSDGDSSSAHLTININGSEFVLETPLCPLPIFTDTPWLVGLQGEYYGYNQTTGLDGYKHDADDGGYGDLSGIMDMESIINGRNAVAGGDDITRTNKAAEDGVPDATFRAGAIDYNIPHRNAPDENGNRISHDGKDGLGTNPVFGAGETINNGKLYDFLNNTDYPSRPGDSTATGSLTASGHFGQTTDAIIRLAGFIDAPNAGGGKEYEIRVLSDDGFRMMVDGQEVLACGFNRTLDHLSNPNTGTITLGDGAKSIEILYWDHMEAATLRIEYREAGSNGEWTTLGSSSGDVQMFTTANGVNIPLTLDDLQDVVRGYIDGNGNYVDDGQYHIRTGARIEGTVTDTGLELNDRIEVNHNFAINGIDAKYELDGLGGHNTLIGGNNDDRLISGAGNDTMTGGGGSDTFIWRADSHGIAAGMPSYDRITDFDTRAKANGGDVLDLRDLLQGEENNPLDKYLHFETKSETIEGNTVTSTVIHVSSEGHFTDPQHVGGVENLQITLQGVDLSGLGGDDQIIQHLISAGKLITD